MSLVFNNWVGFFVFLNSVVPAIENVADLGFGEKDLGRARWEDPPLAGRVAFLQEISHPSHKQILLTWKGHRQRETQKVSASA